MDYIYRRLVDDIRDRSREGKISWSPSSYSGTYQATLGKGVIMISRDVSDDDNYPADYTPPMVSLSFLNERGETFNSINCYTTHDELYDDLMAIYEAANNNYMKIDETLKSMIDDLNNRG